MRPSYHPATLVSHGLAAAHSVYTSMTQATVPSVRFVLFQIQHVDRTPGLLVFTPEKAGRALKTDGPVRIPDVSFRLNVPSHLIHPPYSILFLKILTSYPEIAPVS